jgi:hypothetical protein
MAKFKSNKLVKTIKSINWLEVTMISSWASITFLYGVNIFLTNMMFDAGHKLVTIEQARQVLELDNRILENKIASYSALRYIAPVAGRMGFSPAKVSYIK